MSSNPPVKKILVLTINPKHTKYTKQLRLDEEVRDIQEGLQRSLNREKFDLRYDLAVRPCDIRRAVLDYRANIIYFSGHGSGKMVYILKMSRVYHPILVYGFISFVVTRALKNSLIFSIICGASSSKGKCPVSKI